MAGNDKDGAVTNTAGGTHLGPMIMTGRIDGDVTIGTPSPMPQDRLSEPADQLADAVDTFWRREERRRRIRDPRPLVVRYRPADRRVTDHPENIWKAAGPQDVSGDLNRITDVYQRVPTRRLVVLGRAGSGKTVLALRLVLNLLAARTPRDPVPVIVSLGSWNPADSLEDWLISHLIRDYPWLAETDATGLDMATALVDARRILPVLDGFDEIADDLRPAARRQLSETDMALVLTGRPEEYTTAVVGTRGVHGAAVIELTDLALDDVAGYLRLASPQLVHPDTAATVTVWDPVLTRLRTERGNPAAARLGTVLTTPLMVALARTIYSDGAGRDPVVLLDTDRFGTVAGLEAHLLGSFVPSVYRPGGRRLARFRRWNPERAQHWLYYLVEHLDQRGTRDLAWWNLGTSVRRSVRTLVVAVLAALIFGGVTGVGNLPVDLIATRFGLAFAVRRGLVVGLFHGLVGGLAFGLMYWFADGRQALKPSPVRVGFTGSARQLGARLTTRLRIGMAIGTVFALAVVLLDRLVVGGFDLDDGLSSAGLLLSVIEFAPLVGLGTGVVLGLMTWLEAPIDVKSAVSPTNLLTVNRTTVLLQMLVWAVVFGLGAMLVTSFTVSPLRCLETGLVFGIEAAISGGLGYGLSLTAWGQWMAIARIWLPLTRRLPWRLIAFLDDACQRGVLRQSGAVYQFRHARLQDHLTGTSQTGRVATP